MVQHVYHLLDETYDNELSPGARRRVEAHLAECSFCRAEYEQLSRLGDLLSEYEVPDAFSAAEIFQAQVVLRVARRAREHTGYRGAIWHLVPLALLSLVVVLQALFVLVGVLGRAFLSAQWFGADLGSFLTQVGIAGFETLSIWGLSPSTTVVALSVMLMVALYIGVLALLIPYAGWVGALWQSSRAGQILRSR
jgi:predicted anti-sigma-YlaC factor YlaD